MDGFKQRIIGALIIVSLAVIFLPMLFDEPHQQRRERILEVPPEPEMEAVEVEAPREPEVPEGGEVPEDREGPDIPMADEGEGEVERDEEPVTTLDEPEPTPEVSQEDSGSLKGAYLVRLGSFSSRDNAVRLRDRVREQGMDAHTETVDNDGESFTRVFAGPFSAEDDAEKARKKLESEFSLETMVVEGED